MTKDEFNALRERLQRLEEARKALEKRAAEFQKFLEELVSRRKPPE